MWSDSRGSITHIAALSCCRPGGSSGIPEEPQELPPAKLSAGPISAGSRRHPNIHPAGWESKEKSPKMQGWKAQLGWKEFLCIQRCPASSKGLWKHLEIPEAVVQSTWA